jgi:hypothetical protein
MINGHLFSPWNVCFALRIADVSGNDLKSKPQRRKQIIHIVLLQGVFGSLGPLKRSRLCREVLSFVPRIRATFRSAWGSL